MSQYRTERTLHTEESPARSQPGPLTSIRDVGYEHQRYAMSRGYNSMSEFAIDELLRIAAQQNERLDRLEQKLGLLRGEIDELP